MIVLLIAGIGLLLVGLAAIGFGIPVQEFSFGNTLILAGTVAACTGVILIGLSVVVRELKEGIRRLGLSRPDAASTVLSDHDVPAGGGIDQRPTRDDFSFDNRPGSGAMAPEIGAASPLDDPPEVDVPAEAAPEGGPPAKPRRNLLFASSSRKERERAATKTSDPADAGVNTAAPAVLPPKANAPNFDDAWPPSERGRSNTAPARPRAPAASNETNGASGAEPFAPSRDIEQPQVTVLKSGVVDGMAYSLYSDGSIEAQMPEGMMRFASIDELRSHLDQRP